MSWNQQYESLNSSLEGGHRDEETALQQQMEAAAKEEEDLRTRLKSIDELRDLRAVPLEQKLSTITGRRAEVQLRIAELSAMNEDNFEIPPGPECLKWVESTWFTSLCTGVIALNMLEMFQAMRNSLGTLTSHSEEIDIAFLVWYSFELFFRAAYHQRKFLLGRPSVVCWNYMDSIIVITGLMEIIFKTVSGGGKSSHLSALRMLRLLRMFRVMRVLKLLKYFFQSDLSWIDGPIFEVFIGSIIAVNALVMWLELDYEWKYWTTIEHGFLVIYAFEVVVKMKVHRWQYLHYYAIPKVPLSVTVSDAIDKKVHLNIWNLMDFIIVSAGAVDLWMLPLYSFFHYLTTGHAMHLAGGPLVVMLRIMRIVRIFRLVKLIRCIKPLYNLLMGVAESMAGMIWVFVLALVVLYALAIIFTSFVGKGYLWGGEGPEEAESTFGTVPQSMYMLFKLMNDDQSAVDSIVTTPGGKGLFVLAMVVSNWALLAILTSVMSDNMISASTRTQAEDAAELTRELEEKSKKQLMFIFQEIDSDGSGLINEKEWEEMMKDENKSAEVALAAGVSDEELQSFFSCLCETSATLKKGRHTEAKMLLSYHELIEALKERGSVADKRSQLHILKRLKTMDRRLETRLEILLEAMCTVSPDAAQAVESGMKASHDLRASPEIGDKS